MGWPRTSRDAPRHIPWHPRHPINILRTPHGHPTTPHGYVMGTPWTPHEHPVGCPRTIHHNPCTRHGQPMGCPLRLHDTSQTPHDTPQAIHGRLVDNPRTNILRETHVLPMYNPRIPCVHPTDTSRHPTSPPRTPYGLSKYTPIHATNALWSAHGHPITPDGHSRGYTRAPHEHHIKTSRTFHGCLMAPPRIPHRLPTNTPWPAHGHPTTPQGHPMTPR